MRRIGGPAAGVAGTLSHPLRTVRDMAHVITSTPVPEQLSLLTPAGLPVQFLLDQRTRQRGLAHIAAIKAQLAARHGGEGAQVAAQPTITVAPRRQAA